MKRCLYFTGKYEGRCRAGVNYDSVKDQNHVSQAAVYPCTSVGETFEQCSRFKLDRRLVKIVKAIRCPITLSDVPGRPSKRREAILLEISSDGLSAFVQVQKKSRAGNYNSFLEVVPIDVVHLKRGGGG